jgi:hypothetical protein
MLLGVVVLIWRFDRTLVLILSELRRLTDQLEQIMRSERHERSSAASDSSSSPEAGARVL